MLLATTSALDPPGKDNFLESDNKELAGFKQPALVSTVFLDELIVVCTTRLVHQQCCMVLFLFKYRIMRWIQSAYRKLHRNPISVLSQRFPIILTDGVFILFLQLSHVYIIQGE